MFFHHKCYETFKCEEIKYGNSCLHTEMCLLVSIFLWVSLFFSSLRLLSLVVTFSCILNIVMFLIVSFYFTLFLLLNIIIVNFPLYVIVRIVKLLSDFDTSFPFLLSSLSVSWCDFSYSFVHMTCCWFSVV